MDYKSFYRHLLQEEYPLGGFQMSKSEADTLNTNITDENIFKMMSVAARAKADATKPLAKPRPNASPRPSLKVTPEPKVYTIPTTVMPASAQQFKTMMDKRKPEMEEGIGDDATQAIRNYMRVRKAMAGHQGEAGDERGAGGHGERAKFQRKLHALKDKKIVSQSQTAEPVVEEKHTLQEWVNILNKIEI